MAIRVPIGAPEAEHPDDTSHSSGTARVERLMEDGAFLHRYCERILRDSAAAEDIVQETYLYALKNLDQLERRDSYAPWLATVARRRSANEVRRRIRLDLIEDLPDDHLTPERDPADVVATADVLDRARAALDRLSERERHLLEAQVIDGLSIEELAQRDSSTRSSVKSVLNRARAKLRDAVGEASNRVVVSLAGISASLQRRFSNAGARIQRAAPALPGGVEHASEVITAAVATLVLGASVAAPPADTPARPERPPSPASLTSVSEVPEETPAEGTGAIASDPRPNELEPSDIGTDEPAPTSMTPAPPPDESPAEASSDPAPDAPEPESGPVPDPPAAPESPESPEAPPPPDPPVDPEEPVEPDDEAEEPEDASFSQFASSGAPTSQEEPDAPQEEEEGTAQQSASAQDGGSQSTSDGQTSYVFGLGQVTGNCNTDCAALFRSADGGATWERPAAQGLGEAFEVLVAPGYPEDPRIYIMGHDGLRLSKDGGETFIAVNEPHSGPATMSPDFSSGDPRILIGSPPSWVYDADKDETTPLAATPLTGRMNFFAFPPDHRETGLLLVGSLAQGSGGVKTATVQRCTSTTCEERVELPFGKSMPKLAISSRFADDGVVLAWVGKALFRSTDGGRSFEFVDTGVEGGIQSLTQDVKGTFYLSWTGTDGERSTGGVLRSYDGGLTWDPVGGHAALSQGVLSVNALPDGSILVAPAREAGGGLLCSTDGGTTWLPRCG